MIVRGGTNLRRGLRRFVWRNLHVIAFVVLLEVVAWLIHERIPETEVSTLAAGAVGLLATVVGIFIAFRFNEAYARWWEARILWGGVVNQSRTFARQVVTLLTPERVARLADAGEARDVQRELVHRHLAWTHALRLQLRGQPVWPEIERWLADGEVAALKRARNVVTQLARRQAERVAALFADDTAGHLLLTQLDDTLSRLTDLQGGLERIKNTAFPDRVMVATRILTWVVSLMVAFAFIKPSPRVVVFEMIAVLVIVAAFMLVKQLGDELNTPFENRANDTPMTALCRTIEIDLLQQLGEEDLPPPLEPVDGVLM